MVVVIVLITFATALLLQLAPGTPAQVIAGEGAPPETLAAIDAEYGFDKPIVVQYVDWLGGFVTGDLGTSYRTLEPVWDATLRAAPATVELAVGAVLLALLLAVPTALFCAFRANSVFDRAVNALTSALISTPPFVAALLLSYVFAVQLGWVPVTGWVPLSESLTDNLRYAALPIVALALPPTAMFYRVLRADLGTSLQQDHIALARSKGLSPAAIMLRHALRPSAFSLMTVVGIQLAQLLGTTVVVEVLLGIPGLGSLLVNSVLGQDLITVQGVVVLIALGYLLMNLVVDVSYRLVDPRVKI
jgi:peptide/nickel transport system permease protein